MFSSDHNFIGQKWELLVNKMHVHPLTYCTRVGERCTLTETDDHPLYLLTDPAFALVLITAKFSLALCSECTLVSSLAVWKSSVLLCLFPALYHKVKHVGPILSLCTP